MSKRILSLVLALVMVLGTMGSLVFAEGTGNEKVDELIELGLIQGYGDGTYGLDKTITRAEVATMLVRALDAENEAKAMANIPSIFTDMSPLQWANGYVNYAVGKGIITGYPDKTFRPNNDITYAEVAKMLVEILDGLTDAEKASAVWPTTWLAKAAQLGVFDGVNINDYSAKAVREKVFEMVHNVYFTKEVGNNTIVKAIVLENNRVEKLGKNEIVVEVIRELQASQYPEVSRKEQGDQLKLTIDAKVGDVEDMLGKVYDFTLNREGKVIKAQLDTSYEYKQGKVAGSQISRTKFAGYTVLVGERYNKDDERVFKAVLNNEAGSYTDMYGALDGAGIDFARYTVKNGKVLYIDAYTFEDIAPVKEVKRDGKEVYVYNDYRDARVEKYEPKLVIGYTEKGGFTRISASDIESLDVVHVYNDKYMIVRLDADLTGTYEKVSQNSAGYWVHVDGEKYFINDANYIRPVYSINGEDFETLYVRSASSDLRDLKDEEVTIALDINGDLQYLTGAIDYNETVAVIDNILSKGDVRYILPNNEKLVLEETFDSELYVKGTLVTTNNQRMSKYNIGDLVFVIKDEDTIDLMNKLVPVADINNTSKTYPVVYNATDKAYKMTKDYLIVEDGTKEVRYNVISDTNVFIVNFDDSEEVSLIKGTTMKDVIDNVKADSGLRAYILTTEAYANINNGLYRDKLPQKANNVAHTIIFTNYVEKSSYDTEIIEVTAKYYPGSSRVIEGKYADGETVTRTVSKNATLPTINVGDIVKLSLTKDDYKLVVKAEVLIENSEGTFKIVDIDPRADYRWIELQDASGEVETFWLTSDVKEFGTIALDQLVRFETNAAGDIYVIKSLGKKGNPTGLFPDSVPPVDMTGIVTYINVEEGLIEVDGKVLELDKRVKLVDADGTTLAIGAKEVASKLEKGRKVELTEEKGIVTEIKLVEEKDEDPEPEPEITAEAVVENEALGVSKVVITVKGTTGEEVEKVLVNGSEVKIQRVEENKVTILSAKKVEKVEIVVAGKVYPVTVK